MAIWYARLEGCGHVNLEPLWLYVSLMATEGLSLPNLVETYLSGSIPPTITLAPCVLLSELRRWILKDQSSHHPKGVAMAASRSHWQKAIGKCHVIHVPIAEAQPLSKVLFLKKKSIAVVQKSSVHRNSAGNPRGEWANRASARTSFPLPAKIWLSGGLLEAPLSTCLDE